MANNIKDIQSIRDAREKIESLPIMGFEPLHIWPPRDMVIEMSYGKKETVSAFHQQRMFHECDKKIRLFIAGNRSGKSQAGAAEIAYWVSNMHPWLLVPKSDKRYAERVMWVVGPTYEHIGTVLWPKIRSLLPESWWKSIVWYERGKGMPDTIYSNTGWKVSFKSAQQGREAFQGIDIDAAWLDEDIPSDVVREIEARTIDRAGKIWWTFTPLSMFTEMAIEWHDKAMDNDNNVASFRGSIFGNRYLPAHEVARIYESWDESERRIRAYGEFAQLEGLIYNDRIFTSNNVIDDEERGKMLKQDHTIYLCIDPGYVTTAGTFWSVDTFGRYTLVAEHYGKRMTVAENTQRIYDMSQELGGLPVEHIFMDIAAMQSGRKDGKTVLEEYENEFASLNKSDIMIYPVTNKNPHDRITKVLQAMSTKIDGIKKLRVWAGCPMFFHERKRYIYKNGKPRKKDDHIMNGMEYFVIMNPQHVMEGKLEETEDGSIDAVLKRHRERIIKAEKKQKPSMYWGSDG